MKKRDYSFGEDFELDSLRTDTNISKILKKQKEDEYTRKICRRKKR